MLSQWYRRGLRSCGTQSRTPTNGLRSFCLLFFFFFTFSKARFVKVSLLTMRNTPQNMINNSVTNLFCLRFIRLKTRHDFLLEASSGTRTVLQKTTRRLHKEISPTLKKKDTLDKCRPGVISPLGFNVFVTLVLWFILLTQAWICNFCSNGGWYSG